MRKIIVDSRESRSNMNALLEQQGITVEQQELEIGDYLLAEGLAGRAQNGQRLHHLDHGQADLVPGAAAQTGL